MRFETPRLVIRSFEPADAEALFRVFADPAVRRYLPPAPEPTIERIRAAVERRIAGDRERGFSLWAVERKDSGELIGNCGFNAVEGGPEIELAYHYARSAWNQGFGTEAAGACLAQGFGPLALSRVIALAYPANVGSWRIMEKVGMRYEGTASYFGIDGLKKYAAERATWRTPS